jgi:hypothetical protein
MKKIIYFTILALFLNTYTNAQIVKFIKNPYQAKYRVFITTQPKEASHWVYRVKSPSEIRKGGQWYVVTNPLLFKEAMTLYQVPKLDEADLIVYYVSTADSAMIRQKE